MPKKVRQLILLLGDLVLGLSALFLTIRVRNFADFSWGLWEKHLIPFLAIYAVWFVIFYIFGLYDLSLIKPKAELLTRMAQAFLICLSLGIILFYAVPFFTITPKITLLIDTIIMAILMALWRRLFYLLFSNVYRQNLVFWGKNILAERLIRAIENDPQVGFKFAGFLDVKKNITEQLQDSRADILVIADNLSANPNIAEDLYRSLSLRVKFWDLAKCYETILQKIPIDFVDHRWFLENLTESEKQAYDKVKRITDIVVAFLLLILTLPIWLIIAFLIKIEDRGPIFYQQTRVGRNQKKFSIWKFRSMIPDAERTGPKWSSQNDPRVTKVGRIIKSFHLDELPQMINILKGDISIVGPRPERPEFVRQLEKEIPHYNLRHIVKSGFTGWAQVKFIQYARSVEDSHEKFQYDLYYIKNRSFFLDLAIMLKTFQLFLKREKY